MRLICDPEKLNALSKEDLVQQAAVANYFLANEINARGGELETAHLSDETFKDMVIDFDGAILVPNRSTTLKLIKANV